MRIAATAFLGFVLLCPLSIQAQTNATDGSDGAAVAALYKTFADGFNKRSPDEIMSIYANNGTLFVFDVIPPRAYPSWAAYRKDWVDLFKAYKTIHASVTALHVSVDSDGNTAWTRYLVPTSVTLANGSKASVVVRSTDVLQKIDGKWLIVQEHDSIPVDLVTMKPDPMSKP
jgi:ketosteroid isomerase-like protein